MKSLAKQYGVRRETIKSILAASGEQPRMHRQISEVEVDEAARLYVAGLSLEQIGSKLGWNHKTVHIHLRRRGVEMRGPNDWQHG